MKPSWTHDRRLTPPAIAAIENRRGNEAGKALRRGFATPDSTRHAIGLVDGNALARNGAFGGRRTASAMELSVFLAVVAAAAMHAGWNAVLKIRLDPFLAMVLINGCCSLLAVPLVLVVGLPPLEAVPWLAGSILLHTIYSITLTGAYRRADMGQVYPVARGTAPMLTTLVSVLVLREPIDAMGIAGVAVLGVGIVAMAWRSRGGSIDRTALALALVCGATISGYTLVDGLGARTAGSAHIYIAWLSLFDGLVLGLWALARRGAASLRPALGFLGPGLAGGVMSFGAYWIAIWAMTRAPIGLVAAVRESSVLFGAVFAVWLLREQLRAGRIVAAVMILAGLVLIRLH